MKPSLVQISIEAQEILLAPLSAWMVNVRWSENGVGPTRLEGTIGAVPANTSNTCLSASSAFTWGAMLPFSAISLSSNVARLPTSKMRSLPRCVATTGGVSGCPVVRLWIVTSNVSAFAAIACGAMISAIVAIEAAIRANGLLAMLTSLSCPCEPNQERLRFP